MCTEAAKLQQEKDKDSNKVLGLWQFELKCYLLYLCCPFVDKQLVFVNLLAGQQVGCNQLVSEQWTGNVNSEQAIWTGNINREQQHEKWTSDVNSEHTIATCMWITWTWREATPVVKWSCWKQNLSLNQSSFLRTFKPQHYAGTPEEWWWWRSEQHALQRVMLTLTLIWTRLTHP